METTTTVLPETDPEFIRSFSEWLDSNNDDLPPPESFHEWLERNGDALE